MRRSRFYLMTMGILLMLGLLFASSDRASIVLADIATIVSPDDPTTPTPNPAPGGGGTTSDCGMSHLGGCTCNELGEMVTIRIDRRMSLMNAWDSLQCDPEPPQGYEDICNNIDKQLNEVDGQITAIPTEARTRANPCAWAHP